MSVTPFIKPVKFQGGTFYTCTSAQEDLNYTLDNTKRKFRFSNFALLKIPRLKSLHVDDNADLINDAKPKHNYVQLDAPVGANRAWREDNSTPNLQNNVALAESFENYYYNLETILLNNSNYDIEEKKSVAERVFFKWLKEIGAMRFRQANSSEVVPPSAGYGTRFVEENDSFDISDNPIYERVVKYIGNINVVNSIRNPKNSFTEVYIHIPLSHGNTKDVLFDSVSDKNYSPDMVFPTENFDLNADYLEGREYTDLNPAGLDTHAHFDAKYGSGGFGLSRCWYFNPDTLVFEPYDDGNNPNFKWWYDYTNVTNRSYYLEPTGFSNVNNEVYAIGYGETSDPNDPLTTDHTKFIRNTLDGISLEFNPNVYQKIVGDPVMKSLGDFNASRYATNFSFNTVLVYYDVYDVDDPNSYVTNLFGVLFLDNVDYVSGEGGIIPSFNKYKPNVVAAQNGNSYAYRLNIKFDVNAQDAAVEVSINDYDTFSLQLYLDALTSMKLMASTMDEYILQYKNLYTEVQNLKSLVFTEQSIDELETRVSDLETSVTNAEEVYLNNEALVALINKNYEEIMNIYNNFTSVQMSYNIDVIQQGSGIEVDKSTGQYAKITNTRQAFSLNAKPVVKISDDFSMKPTLYTFYHTLEEFDNYLRINDGSYGSPYVIDRDIVIYVDDSSVSWKKGQRMRISFSYGLNMSNSNGNFNLIVYSDAKDKLLTGYTYSTQISLATYDNFNSDNRYRPIIELICVDPATFQFVTDIF